MKSLDEYIQTLKVGDRVRARAEAGNSYYGHDVVGVITKISEDGVWFTIDSDGRQYVLHKEDIYNQANQ
jgi:preprotein translocase subunit YajC